MSRGVGRNGGRIERHEKVKEGDSTRLEDTWKKERKNDIMHERRDTTAEQLQEKDKCAAKCQGYLIH